METAAGKKAVPKPACSGPKAPVTPLGGGELEQ